MRAVVARRPGGPEVLELTVLPDPVPAPGEVILRVRATAVNRADLLQREGRYPPPPGASDVLGLEAAGTVEAVGAGVTGWAPGDRAMALLAGGGYAERVAVPAGQLMPVPGGMDWVLAAAVPEVFLTAWQALGRSVRPVPGQWVLVHAAASGVGTAALQVARELGARTVATTRSPDKAERLQDMADHVIVPGYDGFAAEVMRVTGGHGADVVVDLVGAAYWAQNLEAVAADGRIALIGMTGGARGELDLARLFARRVTVVASTLRARPPAQKAELVASFADWGLPRLADGRLRPVVHDLLPLARVQDAHRMVQADQPVGKVVLAVSEDGLVER
ncbi:MAG TPA: NAD(P)H-quinone oxidoreductase [Miltoncostaeaceae bacterium]|nr:NAD(P)H-quinone oxidoreductase [Miltoncostaeaceae bacterium]